MDRTRVGVFDPEKEVVERNQRRREEMDREEDESTLDPRVGVFYRDKGDKRREWFDWLGGKTGEERQAEAAAAQTQTQGQAEAQVKEVK